MTTAEELEERYPNFYFYMFSRVFFFFYAQLHCWAQ